MDRPTNDGSRVTDYDKAIEAMESDNYDLAITKFQNCMKKLSSQGLGLNSDLFPKCLQNISNCYNKKGDVENALSFKKFEKLYYETVLLHNGVDSLLARNNSSEENADESLSSRDRGDGSSEASVESCTAQSSNLRDSQEHHSGASTQETSATAKRASEYEQLARLCLQQDCVGLALEYSGKATLLHRHEFGDEHEDTKKSFELFTTIYAEAGKKQYSDSMEQLNLESLNNTDDLTPSKVEETLLRHRKNRANNSEATENRKTNTARPLKRTRSILKKGNSADMKTGNDLPTPETPRRVTFADPLPQMVRLRDEDETDDSSTNLLLFFLVCILIILISLFLSSIVCYLQPTFSACVEFRREFTHYYHKLRYFYASFSK